jgi:hypothetical protein
MYIDLQINYAPEESQRDHKNCSVDPKADYSGSNKKEK